MDAVKGMSSVVCFLPEDSEEKRMNQFNQWVKRHEKEREERAFLGPVIPGAAETRAMLKDRMKT